MAQIEGREDYYANNLDELKALVNDSLDDIADFRYIGASVMGSYFRNATPEQRSRAPGYVRIRNRWFSLHRTQKEYSFSVPSKSCSALVRSWHEAPPTVNLCIQTVGWKLKRRFF